MACQAKRHILATDDIKTAQLELQQLSRMPQAKQIGETFKWNAHLTFPTIGSSYILMLGLENREESLSVLNFSSLNMR